MSDIKHQVGVNLCQSEINATPLKGFKPSSLNCNSLVSKSIATFHLIEIMLVTTFTYKKAHVSLHLWLTVIRLVHFSVFEQVILVVVCSSFVKIFQLHFVNRKTCHLKSPSSSCQHSRIAHFFVTLNNISLPRRVKKS